MHPMKLRSTTRREAAQQVAPFPFLSLPKELQLEVMARLPPTSLMAALVSCKPLAALKETACRAACLHQRPAWVAVAQADAVGEVARGSGTAGTPPTHSWGQQLLMLELLRREEEQHGVVSAAAFRQLQPRSREGHRKILVEWLCELSFLWRLDSPILFKAVEYLDCHLCQARSIDLSKFQLLGCACLRLAMTHAACDAKQLDAARFADMTNNSYTAAQVDAETQMLAAELPEYITRSLSSRHLLRFLWGPLQEAQVAPEEVHIYNVASFLLNLSHLSLDCSDQLPSLLACCAISASLAYFGKQPWPLAALRCFGYTHAQLAPGIQHLLHLQASELAPDLRESWVRACTRYWRPEAGYEEQWQRMLQVMTSPSAMQQGSGAA